MTTDTEMRIRGLCETLASAVASAAACHRALAETLPDAHPLRDAHQWCISAFDDFDAEAMVADHLAAASSGDLGAAWPDALERPMQEVA